MSSTKRSGSFIKGGHQPAKPPPKAPPAGPGPSVPTGFVNPLRPADTRSEK